MAKNKMRKEINRGFTLIELLVVISIIGLLASVVLVALNGARVKSRDVKRIADLKQLSTALELFYNDNGHYPIAGDTADCWRPNQNWFADSGNYSWSTPYISKQPQDPVDNCIWPWGNDGAAGIGKSSTYEYWSDGTHYLLAVRLEDITNPNRNEITGAVSASTYPGTSSNPVGGAAYSTYGPTGKYSYIISK